MRPRPGMAISSEALRLAQGLSRSRALSRSRTLRARVNSSSRGVTTGTAGCSFFAHSAISMSFAAFARPYFRRRPRRGKRLRAIWISSGSANPRFSPRRPSPSTMPSWSTRKPRRSSRRTSAGTMSGRGPRCGRFANRMPTATCVSVTPYLKACTEVMCARSIAWSRQWAWMISSLWRLRTLCWSPRRTQRSA